MDIKDLKYFVVVAEELNITKASKILMMSQPPLSTQMKELEEELGTTLFIRGKKQLTLTESGKLLYIKAKDILSLVDKAKNEILDINLGLSGTISIGLVGGVAPDIVANWIVEFKKQYPLIHFRVIDGNSDDLIEKMRGGLISLAVVEEPYDALFLNAIKVGEGKMVAFINKDHPLTRKETISISELKGEPLIVPSRKAHIDSIRRWFRRAHIEPNIVCEMDNYLNAASLSTRSVGISIFPKTEHILNDSITYKEIIGEDTSIDYLFVWRKGHQLSLIEENFIDFIKSINNK